MGTTTSKELLEQYGGFAENQYLQLQNLGKAIQKMIRYHLSSDLFWNKFIEDNGAYLKQRSSFNVNGDPNLLNTHIDANTLNQVYEQIQKLIEALPIDLDKIKDKTNVLDTGKDGQKLDVHQALKFSKDFSPIIQILSRKNITGRISYLENNTHKLQTVQDLIELYDFLQVLLNVTTNPPSDLPWKSTSKLSEAIQKKLEAALKPSQPTSTDDRSSTMYEVSETEKQISKEFQSMGRTTPNHKEMVESQAEPYVLELDPSTILQNRDDSSTQRIYEFSDLKNEIEYFRTLNIAASQPDIVEDEKKVRANIEKAWGNILDLIGANTWNDQDGNKKQMLRDAILQGQVKDTSDLFKIILHIKPFDASEQKTTNPEVYDSLTAALESKSKKLDPVDLNKYFGTVRERQPINPVNRKLLRWLSEMSGDTLLFTKVPSTSPLQKVPLPSETTKSEAAPSPSPTSTPFPSDSSWKVGDDATNKDYTGDGPMKEATRAYQSARKRSDLQAPSSHTITVDGDYDAFTSEKPEFVRKSQTWYLASYNIPGVNDLLTYIKSLQAKGSNQTSPYYQLAQNVTGISKELYNLLRSVEDLLYEISQATNGNPTPKDRVLAVLACDILSDYLGKKKNWDYSIPDVTNKNASELRFALNSVIKNAAKEIKETQQDSDTDSSIDYGALVEFYEFEEANSAYIDIENDDEGKRAQKWRWLSEKWYEQRQSGESSLNIHNSIATRIRAKQRANQLQPEYALAANVLNNYAENGIYSDPANHVMKALETKAEGILGTPAQVMNAKDHKLGYTDKDVNDVLNLFDRMDTQDVFRNTINSGLFSTTSGPYISKHQPKQPGALPPLAQRNPPSSTINSSLPLVAPRTSNFKGTADMMGGPASPSSEYDQPKETSVDGSPASPPSEYDQPKETSDDGSPAISSAQHSPVSFPVVLDDETEQDPSESMSPPFVDSKVLQKKIVDIVREQAANGSKDISSISTLNETDKTISFLLSNPYEALYTLHIALEKSSSTTKVPLENAIRALLRASIVILNVFNKRADDGANPYPGSKEQHVNVKTKIITVPYKLSSSIGNAQTVFRYRMNIPKDDRNDDKSLQVQMRLMLQLQHSGTSPSTIPEEDIPKLHTTYIEFTKSIIAYMLAFKIDLKVL